MKMVITIFKVVRYADNDFAAMFLRGNKRPVEAGSCAQTAPGDNGSYNNSYQSIQGIMRESGKASDENKASSIDK